VILAGDVGGTKTVLALFERGGDAPVERVRARYRSAEHGSFAGMLERFLADHERPRVEAACFGVAGPVVEGSVVATNLPWNAVDEASLSRTLGGAPVALLNDLQAAAVGMLAKFTTHPRFEVQQHSDVLADELGSGDALYEADGPAVGFPDLL